MKSTTALVAVGLALAATLSASPAMALRDRTFVSPTGNDGNDCSPTTPCRTFQGALAQTNAGGEITVLGTAGYGTVVINKAVSIVNPGGFEASMFVSSNGKGIEIDAGANEAVTLSGLTINGSGTGSGIVFNSGASLTVDNCVIQNLQYSGSGYDTGNGILIQPTSGTMTFTITNTKVLNNGYVGIAYLPPSGTPTANGSISGVVADGNSYGISINSVLTSASTTTVSISNTTASYNASDGIHANDLSGSTMSVSIDNAAIIGNSNGIEGLGNASVVLGRSTIVSNASHSIYNGTSGTFFTYVNNQIGLNGNGNAVGGSALTPVSFN
jgi:hypothetical protein